MRLLQRVTTVELDQETNARTQKARLTRTRLARSLGCDDLEGLPNVIQAVSAFLLLTQALLAGWLLQLTLNASDVKLSLKYFIIFESFNFCFVLCNNIWHSHTVIVPLYACLQSRFKFIDKLSFNYYLFFFRWLAARTCPLTGVWDSTFAAGDMEV